MGRVFAVVDSLTDTLEWLLFSLRSDSDLTVLLISLSSAFELRRELSFRVSFVNFLWSPDGV